MGWALGRIYEVLFPTANVYHLEAFRTSWLPHWAWKRINSIKSRNLMSEISFSGSSWGRRTSWSLLCLCFWFERSWSALPKLALYLVGKIVIMVDNTREKGFFNVVEAPEPTNMVPHNGEHSHNVAESRLSFGQEKIPNKIIVVWKAFHQPSQYRQIIPPLCFQISNHPVIRSYSDIHKWIVVPTNSIRMRKPSFAPANVDFSSTTQPS